MSTTSEKFRVLFHIDTVLWRHVREMVRQEDDRTGASYPNMLFDLQLLDLAADGNFLDWRWISGRRAAGENSETAMLAPSCWRRWIREGNDALSELRLRNWPVEPLSST